jgi:S-DNA-T family DNA segregation ATPase FtsK/SpoIIIE
MAAIAEARRLISPTMMALVRRRLASLAGLLLGLLGIGLGVALASYHPSDASWDTAGTVVRNLAGPSGAVFADLSWQGFGIVGTLPVCVMLVWGWRIAENKRLTHVSLRLLALAVAMPLLAGGLANLPVPMAGSSAWLAAGWGGAAGYAVGNLLIGGAHAALGPLGTAIAWVVEMLVGIGLTAFGFGLTAMEWRVAGSRARTGALGAATLSLRSGRHLAFGMDGLGRRLGTLFSRLPDWGGFAQAPEPSPHPIFNIPPMDPEDASRAPGMAARREPVEASASAAPRLEPTHPGKPAAALGAAAGPAGRADAQPAGLEAAADLPAQGSARPA